MSDTTTTGARERAALPPAGVTLIAIERQRQYTAEGYNAGTDDQYVHGEIGCAAVAYLLAGLEPSAGSTFLDVAWEARSWWPWPPEFFKPENKDEIGKIAGAYIKEAKEMATVAAAGDPAAVKAQFGKLGGSCKACQSAENTPS